MNDIEDDLIRNVLVLTLNMIRIGMVYAAWRSAVARTMATLARAGSQLGQIVTALEQTNAPVPGRGD